MNEEKTEAIHSQPGVVKRLFVAHRLENPAIRQELDQAWRKVSEAIPDWSKPSRERHHHITLRFIGEVDTGDTDQRDRMEQLGKDLREMAGRYRPIPLMLGFINIFHGIALGAVGGTHEALESLRRLRKEVDEAVTRGFQEAEYGFIPHITLGKFDVSATRIIDGKLRDSEYPAQMAFRLDSFELLEGVQSPLGGGSDYVPVIPKLMLRE